MSAASHNKAFDFSRGLFTLFDSFSPLVWQAAWHAVCCRELPALFPDLWEDRTLRRDFWSRLSLAAASDPAGDAWLPAIAAGVALESDLLPLTCLGEWPLPPALSAEAAPWLDTLVASWKKHAGPGLFPHHTWESTLALQVLVRLESRFSLPKHPSHLPDLLRVAEAFIAREDVAAYRKLAALSQWAPSPVAPPPADALRRWCDLWVERYHRRPPLPDPAPHILAVQALLNLASVREGHDHLARHGLDPARLLSDLAVHIRELRSPGPEYRARWSLAHVTDFRYLMLWYPRADTSFPLPALRQVGEALLHQAAASSRTDWHKKMHALEMLVTWDREGMLARCGLDPWPLLSAVLRHETNHRVLEPLVRWLPAAEPLAATRLCELAGLWQDLSGSTAWEIRQTGWSGRIHLLRSGRLTPDEEHRFWRDYAAAVRDERRSEVLATLSTCACPPLSSAHDLALRQQVWLDRLGDRVPEVRFFTVLALWNQWGSIHAGPLDAPGIAAVPAAGAQSTHPPGTPPADSVVRYRRLRQQLRRDWQACLSPGLSADLLPRYDRIIEMARSLKSPSLSVRRRMTSPEPPAIRHHPLPLRSSL